MKKKPSLPKLKKKLWKIFSEFIRKRDADENGMVKCISCPRVDHWKAFDAGHYIPQSISLALTFEEKNVHAQCGGCNLFKRGNQTVYAIELRKRYGNDILEQLQGMRKEGFKFSRSDYEEMIRKYAN